MALCCGCDVGSTTAKAAIFAAGRLVGRAVIPVEESVDRAAREVVQRALDDAGAGWADLACTVSTGYGRERAAFADRTESEIACHGRGALWSNPAARTILDIGGQDAKAIRIDAQGRVVRYQYNDKCASGTGRFLEMMADALEVALEDMGDVAAETTEQIQISSQCVIFAETEVVSLVHAGKPIADIANALHHAMARRAVALVRAVGVTEAVVFTGGVAQNRGVVRAVEKALGAGLAPLGIEPQLAGAIGAALFASEDALAATTD